MIMPNSNNKHTMSKKVRFVGLDVHAKEITVALAEGARREAAGERQGSVRAYVQKS